MSSLVALFKVSWYGVKIWFTIYKGYGSVMSIKDLIKELDSNLIVDDIEKKKIAFILIVISQWMSKNVLIVAIAVLMFIVVTLEQLRIYQFKITR